jgi:hypothetical protein
VGHEEQSPQDQDPEEVLTDEENERVNQAFDAILTEQRQLELLRLTNQENTSNTAAVFALVGVIREVIYDERNQEEEEKQALSVDTVRQRLPASKQRVYEDYIEHEAAANTPGYSSATRDGLALRLKGLYYLELLLNKS